MLALYGPSLLTTASMYPMKTTTYRPPLATTTSHGGGLIVLPKPPPAPTPGPISYPTAPPPDVPLNPPVQVPGAGPTIVTSPGPGGAPSTWYDLFDPNAFAWWKPVLLAVGLAAFGGAIIAAVRHKR